MKKFIKVDYDEEPTLFTIMSAFRSLLRRSVLFDINVETNSRCIYSPDDNLTLSDNDMLEQMKMFKENFDVPTIYRKKHKYILGGKEKEIQYRFNNVGYRGEDIIGSEKFIAIGCSQTFGSCLEEEFTWPAQLERIFNSRVVNLGAPGDSARGSIMKAISYINQFGKPEAIFACFPLYRSERFAVPGKLINSKNDLAGPFNCMYVKDNFKQISKAPYKYDEIIPMEDHLLETFSFINIFSAYCKEAGIKFIWTGWETMFASNRVRDILNKNTSGFFFDISMNDFNFVKDNPECHKEYLGHPLFDYAADITVESDGRKIGHKGIHWNIHMAEKCYLEYLNLQPIDYSIEK
jgi:hypothetical protein